MHLIDTHTHLATQAYADNLSQILDHSRAVNVKQWIAIGTDLQDSRAGIELAGGTDGMFCTVGIHPHEAARQPEDYIQVLTDLTNKPRVCAVGEIGLDYHYHFSEPKIQQQVFIEQLQMARGTALPIVIHCREAIDDCMSILSEWNQPDKPVVFHCFSSGKQDAKRLLDQGHWLSFTGTITFKNAQENQQAAQYAPLDRVMLETDCPYLSPAPMRKIKPNEPALLIHTAEKLAQLRGKSLEEIAEETSHNSRYFFKLDE